MRNKPIKRHIALQPLSRDHHQGLLLCWKIRKGVQIKVENGRIYNYIKWFFQQHLHPHFALEEMLVFPIIGAAHPLVEKAMTQHSRLRNLANTEDEVLQNILEFEKELYQHIRFEERILFQEIEKIATETQLGHILNLHGELPSCDDWKDKFWEE